ncbi:MAG: DOMON domain-containing protein [Bacteroidota bacterium]
MLTVFNPGTLSLPLEEDFRSIQKNGMAFQWRIQGEFLEMKLSGPTIGWIAMGFNPKPGLTGTNLIMGHVTDQGTKMEDLYILGPGNPQPVNKLGGTFSLPAIKGHEDDSGTYLEYQIPLQAKDAYHHTLKPGQQYYVLLAYSVSDDFDHHSRMRTEVSIIL